jgi:hypothetical protein
VRFSSEVSILQLGSLGIKRLEMEMPKNETLSHGSDEDTLISLGHKPELKRTYNFWSCRTLNAFERPRPD